MVLALAVRAAAACAAGGCFEAAFLDSRLRAPW